MQAQLHFAADQLTGTLWKVVSMPSVLLHSLLGYQGLDVIAQNIPDNCLAEKWSSVCMGLATAGRVSRCSSPPSLILSTSSPAPVPSSFPNLVNRGGPSAEEAAEGKHLSLPHDWPIPNYGKNGLCADQGGI